ncbi:DUF4197 domain-containing protein [Acidihalobacter yilgarnensis]|nr:DUF4197 domain-containing protein [Acidihalobacter yilgarnensis]
MLLRNYYRPVLFAAIAVFALMPAAHAGFREDLMKSFGTLLNGSGTSSSSASTKSPAAGLTQTEMSRGIKEALSKGVNVAIDQLGRRNGFLDDAAVRIPLPSGLDQVASVLRQFHQQELADKFVATMNHAAEQAVPQAAEVFAGAIRHMTLQDVRGILQGPDDAATEYFRRTSGAELAARLRPIIARATNKAGVTLAYKKMIAEAGPMARMFVGDSNLDAYITKKTLDGLFLKIAAEEKSIRTQPAARTTDLLKKVFSSVR